jgi:protein-tyrosine phosphatase
VRILFVCTGNICRSPMAEGILKDKLYNRRIRGEVDSAGLEEFHVGDAPDKRAQITSLNHGIDISGHRARLVTPDDFDRFDKIFIMDSYHYQQLATMSRSDTDMQKVDYIRNMVEPGRNLEVADPWYNGMQAFENTFEQLDRACENIAVWMTDHH